MARNRLTRACRRDSDCVRRAVASSHPPRRRSRRVDSSSTALTRRCWLARSARGSARPIRLSMICRTISRQPPRVDRSSAARGARSVPDSLRVTASRERSASSAERLNSSAKPVSPVSAQARKARTSRAKASPNAWSSLRTGVTCSATWLCRRAVRRATAPGRMARASRERTTRPSGTQVCHCGRGRSPRRRVVSGGRGSGLEVNPLAPSASRPIRRRSPPRGS